MSKQQTGVAHNKEFFLFLLHSYQCLIPILLRIWIDNNRRLTSNSDSPVHQRLTEFLCYFESFKYVLTNVNVGIYYFSAYLKIHSNILKSGAYFSTADGFILTLISMF